MALRSPTQIHSYWGPRATAALPTSTDVELGDTVFDTTVGKLKTCTATGPVVWSLVAPVGVTSVGASAPITSSGGTTPVIGLTSPLPIANGGTALAATPTNGQLLIGNGAGYTLANLTPGSGIAVTNGAGTITVATTMNAVTQVEVDFGSLPSWGAEFTVVDATVSPSSNIVTVESGSTATGRVGNDQAWDQLSVAANPGSGSFTLTAIPFPGPVVGKRKILYQVF